MSETPQEFYSGCTEPDFPPWWEKFGKRLAADSRMSVEMIAMAAWSVARELAERGAAGGLPPSPLLDTVGTIAGLVNSYHNDGTTLTAAETIRAIADVLGPPMAAGGLPPSGPPEK